MDGSGEGGLGCSAALFTVEHGRLVCRLAHTVSQSLRMRRKVAWFHAVAFFMRVISGAEPEGENSKVAHRFLFRIYLKSLLS